MPQQPVREFSICGVFGLPVRYLRARPAGRELSLVSMDRKLFARYLMDRHLSVRDSLGEKEIKLVGHFQNSLAGDI